MQNNHLPSHFPVLTVCLFDKIVRIGCSVVMAAMMIGISQPVPMSAAAPATPLVLSPANGASPTPSICYATIDGVNVFSSLNANAVQQAVDAASDGNTVKVAGLCAGTQSLGGSTQTVYISKTLTLQGGYTNTLSGWLFSDPIANPTVLDAQSSGRVIYATTPVTVSNLTVQNGNNISNGGGAYFGSTATLSGTQFISNTTTNGWGGAYLSSTTTLNGGLFQNNTALQGGELYAYSTVALTDTQFISNSASGTGAAHVSKGPPR